MAALTPFPRPTAKSADGIRCTRCALHADQCSCRFFVTYRVGDASQRAGPYTARDVDYQRRDIATFERVHDVQIVAAPISK